MLQFLRFHQKEMGSGEFTILSGPVAVKFFIRRTLYLFIFVYSTLFLAVATPFVKTPFIPLYFLGGIATTIYLIRYINYIIMYRRFRGGSIAVTPEGITLTTTTKPWFIPVRDITYMEHNIIGNLLIREKTSARSFPLVLMTEDDREKLVGLFEDLAPGRSRVYKQLWEVIDAVAVALVLAVHIIQFIVQAYYIPTGSMEDTLLVGDHLFVEKITYGPIIPQMAFMKKPIHLSFLGIRNVQRGDIVIFRPPHEDDKDYIKRCIAIPGDDYRVREGGVFINGKKIEEPYTKGITVCTAFNQGCKNIEGTVPPGKVVVMGDNRENSSDSRYFGYLDIGRIKGRALFLYWNTGQILHLDFGRIFRLIR